MGRVRAGNLRLVEAAEVAGVDLSANDADLEWYRRWGDGAAACQTRAAFEPCWWRGVSALGVAAYAGALWGFRDAGSGTPGQSCRMEGACRDGPASDEASRDVAWASSAKTLSATPMTVSNTLQHRTRPSFMRWNPCAFLRGHFYCGMTRPAHNIDCW